MRFQIPSFYSNDIRCLGLADPSKDKAHSLGWSTAVLEADISEAEIEQLKATLVDLVRKQPDHVLVGSAIFALGKLQERDLIPILTKALKDQLPRDSMAMYQTLISLNNLGEDVGFRGSASFDDVERNRRLAVAYLNRKGQTESKLA